MRRLTLVPLLFALSVASWAASVRQVAIIDLPGQPGFGQVVMANNMLVMTHPAANTVDIFDPVRRRLIGHVKDMSRPSGIAVNSDGSEIYVANRAANNVVVLKTQDWQVQRTIPVSAAPESVLAVPNSHYLLVTVPEKQAVVAIDLARGQEIADVDIGGRPGYMAFDTKRNTVFVTVQDRKEVVVLNDALRIAKRIPVTGSMPTGVAFDAKADRLYVSVRYAVVALDANSGNELSRVPAAAGIDQLWLDEANQNLFGMASGALFLMQAGSRLGAPVEVAVDVKGHAVAFDPEKKLIYVPGGREGRSKMLILKQVSPGAAPQTQNAQVTK